MGLADGLRGLRSRNRPDPSHGHALHAPLRRPQCCRCWQRSLPHSSHHTPAAPKRAKRLQQFSTPIPLGLAAGDRRRDHGGRYRARTIGRDGAVRHLSRNWPARSVGLNEIAETRAELLSPPLTGYRRHALDAAHIDDQLDPAVIPSVVLMNPPFSALARRTARMSDTTSGISPRRSRGSPRAGGWSRSPARMSAPRIRAGARPSPGCRNAAARRLQLRRSRVGPMPGTARRDGTRLTVIDRVPADRTISIVAQWGDRETPSCFAGSAFARRPGCPSAIKSKKTFRAPPPFV